MRTKLHSRRAFHFTEYCSTKRNLVLAQFWFVFALACACSIANGQDRSTLNSSNSWISFQNGGQSQVAFELPTTWKEEGSSIAWRYKIEGYGQSSPVVANSIVVVTSTSGPNKEEFHVSAINLLTGELRWSQSLHNPTPEENNTYISRAAPTPTIDDDAIYCLNEGGLLVSYDFEGKEHWRRNLVADFGAIKARHGLAASLEQDDESVFVWIERGEDPYLMAVNKKSGETTWKVPSLGATTWGSPRLIPVGEEHHLVCSASGLVAGFSPKTGEKLWEVSDLSNNTSSTPIPAGNNRFFIAASDGRGEESSNAANSNGLIEIVKSSEGDYSAKFLWRAEKASCSFGSPAIAEGRVWIVNRTGALYQLDVETGAQLATSRIKAGSIWATPLSDASHLFLFGQKGTTSVIDLKSGREVATNELWGATGTGASASEGSIQYAAAAANGYLLIRSGSEIVAIH